MRVVGVYGRPKETNAFVPDEAVNDVLANEGRIGFAVRVAVDFLRGFTVQPPAHPHCVRNRP
jgi:hypothetical protein